MKKNLLNLFFSIICISANAAVDTVTIASNSMHKNVKCVVVTPALYNNKSSKFPVVYLLHGAGGAYNNFVRRVPDLQELADLNEMILVCPDALLTSWYFDSPVDSLQKYETNVGIEIPKYIDEHYRTIADRRARAITGFSMGGHGALFLGFRHSETFGACGSMSGALDVSLIKRGYGMEKTLGDTVANQHYYQDWSVMKVIENYPKDSLAIIIDCGTEDFIFFMTKAAHEKMMKLKIPHDYIERPGRHEWPYWNKSVRYQLLFFKEYFRKSGLIKKEK